MKLICNKCNKQIVGTTIMNHWRHHHFELLYQLTRRKPPTALPGHVKPNKERRQP